MRKLSLVCFAVLIAMVFAMPLRAAEPGKVQLRYKFVKDSTLNFAADVNITTEIPSVGKQVVAANAELTMKVVSQEGPLTNLEMRIARMKMAIAGLGISFNSASKEDREKMQANPGLKPILLMVDTPIKVTMKETGEVTAYDVAELKRKLETAGMQQMMGDLQEQLDQLANGSLILLPDHPVGKGDTWQGKLRTTSVGVGKIEVGYTFTLDGIEKVEGDQCARLSVVGSATQKAEGPVKLVKYDEKGTILFSIDRGKLVSSKVDGNIRFATPNGQEVGVELNVKIQEAERKPLP